MKDKITIICGETGSGKSDFAIDMAIQKKGVIINCDSQQIYRDTPVLSAAPSAQDKKFVPHKLYEFLNGNETYSVQQFLNDAGREIKNAWKNNLHPIIVGGTGMYINALVNGLSPIPTTNATIREKIRSKAQTDLASLYEELQKIDPESANKIKPADSQRICRAMEVYETTGKPISHFQNLPKEKIIDAKFDIIQCRRPKEILEKRFALRVEKMIEHGAIDEAKHIIKTYSETDPIMNVIGVKELIEHLKGYTPLKVAKEKIVIATRQYAKRQRTYFRNQFPQKTIVELI